MPVFFEEAPILRVRVLWGFFYLYESEFDNRFVSNAFAKKNANNPLRIIKINPVHLHDYLNQGK